MTQIEAEVLHIFFTIFLIIVIIYLTGKLWVIYKAYIQLQKRWRTQELLLGREKRRNKSLKRQNKNLNRNYNNLKEIYRKLQSKNLNNKSNQIKDTPDEKYYGC